MATSYKALAIANELADKLKTRQALAVVQSFDTDGYPLISVGTLTPGSAGFMLKVAAVAWPLAQDILGLAQNVFTPHVISIATEADPAGGAGADPTTRAQLFPVLGQCLAMGCQTDWYESTNGTAPSAATIADATKLKVSYQPDHYHALVSNQ